MENTTGIYSLMTNGQKVSLRNQDTVIEDGFYTNVLLDDSTIGYVEVKRDPDTGNWETTIFSDDPHAEVDHVLFSCVNKPSVDTITTWCAEIINHLIIR